MKLAENLSIVGEQLRLARLRRDLSIEQVAERAQCSRLTVAKLEKGLPTVSVGTRHRGEEQKKSIEEIVYLGYGNT